MCSKTWRRWGLGEKKRRISFDRLRLPVSSAPRRRHAWSCTRSVRSTSWRHGSVTETRVDALSVGVTQNVPLHLERVSADRVAGGGARTRRVSGGAVGAPLDLAGAVAAERLPSGSTFFGSSARAAFRHRKGTTPRVSHRASSDFRSGGRRDGMVVRATVPARPHACISSRTREFSIFTPGSCVFTSPSSDQATHLRRTWHSSGHTCLVAVSVRRPDCARWSTPRA